MGATCHLGGQGGQTGVLEEQSTKWLRYRPPCTTGEKGRLSSSDLYVPVAIPRLSLTTDYPGRRLCRRNSILYALSRTHKGAR